MEKKRNSKLRQRRLFYERINIVYRLVMLGANILFIFKVIIQLKKSF